MLSTAIQQADQDLIDITKRAHRLEFFRGENADKEWQLAFMLRQMIAYANTLVVTEEPQIEGKLACLGAEIKACLPYIPVTGGTIEATQSAQQGGVTLEASQVTGNPSSGFQIFLE